MARVLFLMRYALAGDSLRAKFDGQLSAVGRLGHEAHVIAWGDGGLWLMGPKQKRLLTRCPLERMPGYAQTVFYVDLMRALQRALALERFDLVYLRFMPVFFNAPRALARACAQGAKLVVEHPTYPFENGRVTSLARMPVFAYNRRVFRRIEPLIDLYALIGEPCGGRLNGRPAINITNGVDVDALALHAPRPEKDVGMLALASMSRWQGYDRLLDALARYRGNVPVTVHLVGGEGDGALAEWRRMSESLGLNAVFHGELHGKALDAAAAMCDIGVGGLGLYRKGQMESRTLKLREYMARGLPFVYAVDDPDVPDNQRFCLRVPNDDSPLNLEAMVAFALAAKADAQAPALMRAYAREHMSWDAVMRRVLDEVGLK